MTTVKTKNKRDKLTAAKYDSAYPHPPKKPKKATVAVSALIAARMARTLVALGAASDALVMFAGLIPTV